MGRSRAKAACAQARDVLGEDDPETAASLDGLGSVLMAIGDLQGARGPLAQALAIRRQILGEEHPDTAASLDNLGFLL